MKIVSQDATGFRPVTVSITLETQEELNSFHAMGEKWYNTNRSGSMREKMGIDIMGAVSNQKTNDDED